MAPTSPKIPKIPIIYTIYHLYVEPIMAFNGAILAHFQPAKYLNTMSGTATYTPSAQVIFNQLAATYVLFAFNEAVVLRLTNDLRVWKTMVCGMLVSDLLHLYASWCELGPDVFFTPRLWRSEDWLNLGLLVLPVVLRCGFLSGVGFTKAEGQRGKVKGG